MSYKRALWTSGYKYRLRCPYCGTLIEYTDRQLGFRSWYPNGFIYCPGCRKPQRHNEIFAVHPDGTPVYATREEANRAIVDGFYRSRGIPVPPGAYAEAEAAAGGTPPDGSAAAGTSAAAGAGGAAAPASPAPEEKCPACGAGLPAGSRFCPQCGAAVPADEKNVCAACGKEIPKGSKFCPFCGKAAE